MVFAEEIQEPITVNIDKSTYLENETVEITGQVKAVYTGMPVTIIVKSPLGNLVAVDQITIDENKKFSTIITIGGMIKTNGSYTISAMYSQDTVTTSFEVLGYSPDVIEDSIQIEGSFNPITYEITGGKLVDIKPNVQGLSLIVTVDAFDNGSVTLHIPKTVLDSVKDEKDHELLILIDGEQTSFEETITSIDRTITISFPEGTSQIEIIGTFVIPEFGTIAAMILAVAIISIIAVSSKSRLNIMPRY
jgi:predicted secreted protein with PEFG-CTERM motif